ncbi:hypothetical protein Acr_00g0060290 [Actinidia rufa]|uniref:DUF4283 domain-containing protein n=1 Tax=Actinidia rufa TaxID=165716 RepID=A0A7J0DNB6_9ERIC|nr:hypothetical protein Acr_00g0060290 [Actinidia rufa]
MGRGKNRSKKGGQVQLRKREIDSVLAAAVARPNSSSNGGLIAKYVYEDFPEDLEIIPEIESEWEVQEIESEDASQTLGEQDSDCTSCVRQYVSEEESEGNESEDELIAASQSMGDADSVGDEDSVDSQSGWHNANYKTEIEPIEHAGSVEVSERVSSPQGGKKVPYVRFFENNRRPSLGSQLDQIETGDGPIPVEAEEVQDTWSPWKSCLVGYFGGRFPGKIALNQIVKGWQVPVKIHHHNSGWNMFQFENTENQMKVLENSPYIVYVEIDMAKNLPQAVMLKLTSGEIIEQPIFYENLPRFCKHCRIMGHSVEGCGVQKNKPKDKQKEADGTTKAMSTDLDQVAAAATTTTQTAQKGKRGQTEWVQVQGKPSKFQPDNRNLIPNGLELGNRFNALDETLETEVERLQTQVTESGQTQVNRYGNNHAQHPNKVNQPRGQIRGAVHSQNAIQTTSGKLKTTNQKHPMFQSGISVAAQNRITSQIIRKPAAANTAHRSLKIYQSSSFSTTPSPPLTKEDDARKKNEMVQAGRAGNEDQVDDFINIYLQ